MLLWFQSLPSIEADKIFKNATIAHFFLLLVSFPSAWRPPFDPFHCIPNRPSLRLDVFTLSGQFIYRCFILAFTFSALRIHRLFSPPRTMSDSSTTAASALVPPPEGLNYIAAIQPGLTFIMIATPLATMLVPVIILLYFFSTPASRMTAVFNLNVFICLWGLLLAFLNDALEWKQILTPLVPIQESLFLSTIVVSVMTPLFVDSVLLTRIVAFYPSHRTTVQQRIKVLAVPVVCKIVRFIMLCCYFQEYRVKARDLGSVLLVGGATWFRNPFVTTEWTLQIIDNSYVCLSFIHQNVLMLNASWLGTAPCFSYTSCASLMRADAWAGCKSMVSDLLRISFWGRATRASWVAS